MYILKNDNALTNFLELAEAFGEYSGLIINGDKCYCWETMSTPGFKK